MPVYQLTSEMPYDELVNWLLYFKERPIGWRNDNRAYMLLAAQGVKQKPEALFNSLAQIKKVADREAEERRLSRTLVSSGLFARLQQAAVSENIKWEVSIDDQDHRE
jgi:hypothetical protein